MVAVDDIVNKYLENARLAREYRFHRPLTDAGNAERFADSWHETVRFNHSSRCWMIFDGKRWTRDERGLALHLARVTVRGIYGEAGTLDSESERKATASHARKSESIGRIRAMLELAAGDPQLSCTQSDFDADPDLFNTPSGVFNLRTGEQLPHSPDQMLSKISAIQPDPNHDPTAWIELLDFITAGRADLKTALQRFFGSGASGRTPKERLLIAYGTGANSKTATFETAARALGDYASPVAIETLSSTRRAAGHSDDLAALQGTRFTYAAEPGHGIRLDEGRVKMLTGGDKISASHKGERTFTYRPAASISILTNHKPRITGRDTGIWRRMALFPFLNTIPEEKRDPEFSEKLWEKSGPFILAWIIAGAVEWYRDGWGDSETIKAATDDYRLDEDVFQGFIDDCCEINPLFTEQAGRLRKAYEQWCSENGHEPFRGRTWGEALAERGFSGGRNNAGRYYTGIKLQDGQNVY